MASSDSRRPLTPPDATRDERPAERPDERERTWLLGAESPGADASLLHALSVGTRLGRFEIVELLGAGGMGRVYGARDPVLGREVAIKALAGAFRADLGGLRRLEREAKVLAALSHPNIASIYGFEELDGAPYLVLEKIDGGTLSQRLARGALAAKEAIAIGVQVADGLAEAHAKGVIHRDLKPSNVMLTSGGRVKLVDFGLAKSMEGRQPGSAPSDLTTAVGAILGTAPYMSPEQIRGEELDTRTDVWAFGCLLYEMLSGRPAFWAATPPEILAAALRDEPNYAALGATVPEGLRWVIRRCLVKEREQRTRHIGDLGLELGAVASELALPSGRTDEQVTPGRPPRRWRRVAMRAAVVVTALAAGLWAGSAWLRPRGPAESTVMATLSLELPRGMSFFGWFAAPYAISADGSTLVASARHGEDAMLYRRRLDDPAFLPIPGSEHGWQPAIAPDGRRVAFFADRKVLVAPLAGEGAVLPLAELGTNPRGAAWLPDGSLVVAPSQTSGLLRVPTDPEARPSYLTRLEEVPGEHSHRWPEVLPGSEWVLYTVGFEGSSYDQARIDAVSVRTGERRPVLEAASYPRYLASGHLLFVRTGRVYAVGFDPRTLTIAGAPTVVLDGVRYDPQNGAAHLAVAGVDTVVYTPGTPSSGEAFLSWLDGVGRLERLTSTPREFREPRLSPDGRRVAVVVGSYDAADLRVLTADGTLTQLSFDVLPARPTWTPDGRLVTVGIETGSGWQLVDYRADGGGQDAVLFAAPVRMYPCAWTPDGRSLVFQAQDPSSGWDLRILDVEVGTDGVRRAAGTPRPLATTPFHETNAVVSADGRFVAYESDEVDALVQIYVRSLPDGSDKRLVEGSARWPAWGADGTLYSWDTGGRLLRASATRRVGGRLAIDPGAPVLAEAVRQQLGGRILVSVTGRRFDVDRRGARFLVLEAPAVEEPPFIQPVVAFGWGRRLLGGPGAAP